MVKAIVAQLKDFGHPRRGWLGVRIQQVTPDIAESLGLKDASGAMVAGVNDGGPADKAKIHNGDIILKFNNQDVKEMRSLPRIVADSEVGKQVPGPAVARRQGSDGAGDAGREAGRRADRRDHHGKTPTRRSPPRFPGSG